MECNDTYNESMLKQEDKKTIRMMETVVDEAVNTTFIEETGVPTIDKLLDETAEKVKASVKANAEALIYNAMVAMIEGYEEEGDNT